MIYEFLLYLIPLIFTVWVVWALAVVWEKQPDNRKGWFMTAPFFVLFLIIWWVATINVVGPVF